MADFPKLILASQSPRRKELLQAAGLDFEVVASHSDEYYPQDLPLIEVPTHIARNKALAVKEKLGQIALPILAADTIVILENEILGKPENESVAKKYLQKLSGKTHQVITGVALLYAEGREIIFSVTTNVTFYPLSSEQIEFYVSHFKPFDKAGAYGIQEWIGLIGVEKIEGDYNNVVGLPVAAILQRLKL